MEIFSLLLKKKMALKIPMLIPFRWMVLQNSRLCIAKIKTKSLGGVRSFQALQGKNHLQTYIFSWLEHCLSLHFALQSCGRAGAGVPDLGRSWRRCKPVRHPSFSGGLRGGLSLPPLVCVWVKDTVDVLSGPLWRHFPLRPVLGFAWFLFIHGWDLPQAHGSSWVRAHPWHTAHWQPCPLPPACCHHLPPALAPNPNPFLPHRPHQAESTPKLSKSKPGTWSDPESPNGGPCF